MAVETNRGFGWCHLVSGLGWPLRGSAWDLLDGGLPSLSAPCFPSWSTLPTGEVLSLEEPND